MKKSAWLVIISICSTILIAGIAYAGVTGSKHDFSLFSGTSGFRSTSETEVCIFCHTPHGASAVPLWNRNLDSSGYTMYNSSTLNATLPSAPTGISLLCMSCHDGVSAINVVVNYGPNGPIAMPANYDQLGDLSYDPSRNPNLTKNLSNDHPVSFDYNAPLVAADTASRGYAGLVDPTTPATIAPLKLFNGKLECATCHDPHDDGNPDREPFLRMSNAGSGMCLSCHIK